MWHVRLQMTDDDGNILGEKIVDVGEDLLTGFYMDRKQDSYLRRVQTAATQLYLAMREERR